ncbi:hypothetical protein QQP08_004728, partial [Theobroma cacao]
MDSFMHPRSECCALTYISHQPNLTLGDKIEEDDDDLYCDGCGLFISVYRLTPDFEREVPTESSLIHNLWFPMAITASPVSFLSSQTLTLLSFAAFSLQSRLTSLEQAISH